VQSPKNYVLLFLLLTTLAGAAIAWQQYQELISLRAAAMDNDERARWQKRLWAAEKQRADLEAQLATQRKSQTHDEADAITPERGLGGRANGRANFMAMMDRPEIQRLMALQQKAGLDSRYAGLFKALALTPEQLEKFKNLLVEKRTAMMDVMSAAREQGINPRTDPDAFQKLVADSQTEIDANIRSTLGDTDFAQYQSYEQTLPQRNTVSQLEQRLSYSSTPLTDAQSAQMVQIMAANAPPPRTGANGAPAPLTALGAGMAATLGNGGPGGRVTDADINQASGVLAAPQIDALKQIQQEQQAQAQLNAAMRAQFQNNRAGSTPAAPTSSASPSPGG